MNLLIGIGNRFGGDDFIGSWVARNFGAEGWLSLDCGTVPENFTSDIRRLKPERIVIVDAADMGIEPGEIRIIDEEKIDRFTPSTHSIPLSVFVGYLKEFVKEIVIIGIQPKKFEGNLSEEVRRAGEKLINILKEKDWMERLQKL